MQDSALGGTGAEAVPGWPKALGLTLAALAALLGLYHDTLASMLAIWQRSETYAHGYLIFPISAWLIWQKRAVLARIAPRPDYRAAPVLALGGLGWWLAHAIDVLVVEQLALVGMIPALVWWMLGWPVLRAVLFPMGFLVFSVPMGEFLVPPLMNFTADFTVAMLQFTGIPVFLEGTFFSIPSGDWSVIEACSGLRYLIASITLGFLYAYMSYVSPWRRLAFMALSVGLPIIANGLRAYMIVMIGHLSGMTLAVGVDHLIYGWVFFGFVMLLMFWVGSFWTDIDAAQAASPVPAPVGTAPDGWAFGRAWALALLVAAVGPARAAYVGALEASRDRDPVVMALPEGDGAWQAVPAFTEWTPHYSGQDAGADRAYGNGADKVAVYVRYYRHQKQGAELINSRNMLIPQIHDVWKMPEERSVEVSLAGRPVTVLQGLLKSTAGQRLLVWRWNLIGGSRTADDYQGKLLEAKDKLLGGSGEGAAFILATEYSGDPKTAEPVLRRFAEAMLPALEQGLDRTVARR